MASEMGYICQIDEIAAYIEGELDPARASELDEHFSVCKDCLDELNQQKLFLRGLDHSLQQERELVLPADFAKKVVANAESTVSGLRRPRERFNALFICTALLLFALFAMGGEAGQLFYGALAVFDQLIAVGSLLGHLIFSFFAGIAIIFRSIASQFRIDALILISLAAAFSLFLMLFSRMFLRIRRS
jgi:hypothetical protein